MAGKLKKEDAPVLEHEILKALYSATMGIAKFGLTADSSIPIHKRDYKTGKLDYSVLVDMLNSPEKYTAAIMNASRQADIYYYQNLVLTTEDITIKNYSYQQVSAALENLAADGNITEDDVPNILGMRQRPINLTKQGERSYLNETYTAKFAKETLDEKLGKLGLLTDERMKTFARYTGIIAIAAVLILIAELYHIYADANKPAPKTVPVYVYKDLPKADTTAHQYIPAMKASMDSMKATMDSILLLNKKGHHLHKPVDVTQ